VAKEIGRKKEDKKRGQKKRTKKEDEKRGQKKRAIAALLNGVTSVFSDLE